MVISSRKFEHFEMFCPLGAMKLGVQQKSDCIRFSQARTPHKYIFFDSGVTGKCRNWDKE